MVEFGTTAAVQGRWDTIIARPGMVVKRGTWVGETSVMIAGASGSFIRSDELALALIDAVMHGSENLLLPPMLLKRGRELFAIRGRS
jgi:hypothetical protein